MQPVTVDRDGAQQADGDGYRALDEEIRRAGLLERRPGSYSVRLVATLLALATGWAGLVLLGGSWAVLGVAAFLAVMFTQLGFVGHDAGHQQIFRSPRANRCVGFAVANVLTGLSFGWWVRKHNAHHVHPNQVGRDPDIGAGVIAFTAETAQRASRTGRLLASWQAWLFFPLLLLEGLALHVASIQALVRRRDRMAVVEGLLLGAHAVLYLSIVFWVLSPLHAVVFVAVQQGLFGLYLGCTFAPNHKGMPILDHDARLGFVQRQVLTSRNVAGGAVMALVTGGLNYQIEHHLFPTMPRRNLPRAQPIVRAYCDQHGLAYHQESLVGSFRLGLRHLRVVGAGGSPTLAS